jgi:hypothetical protein
VVEVYREDRGDVVESALPLTALERIGPG